MPSPRRWSPTYQPRRRSRQFPSSLSFLPSSALARPEQAYSTTLTRRPATRSPVCISPFRSVRRMKEPFQLVLPKSPASAGASPATASCDGSFPKFLKDPPPPAGHRLRTWRSDQNLTVANMSAFGLLPSPPISDSRPASAGVDSSSYFECKSDANSDQDTPTQELPEEPTGEPVHEPISAPVEETVQESVEQLIDDTSGRAYRGAHEGARAGTAGGAYAAIRNGRKNLLQSLPSTWLDTTIRRKAKDGRDKCPRSSLQSHSDNVRKPVRIKISRPPRLPVLSREQKAPSHHHSPCSVLKQSSQAPPRDLNGRGRPLSQAKRVGSQPTSPIVRRGCREYHLKLVKIKTRHPKSSIVANSRSWKQIRRCPNWISFLGPKP